MLETVEEREVAKERFSQVDKSWATVQTKIRIWTWLELEARKVTLECSVEAVARVEGWLEEEFKDTPEDWLDKQEISSKGCKDGELSSDDHVTADTVVPPNSNRGDDTTRKGGGVKLLMNDENMPEGWTPKFRQEKLTSFYRRQESIIFDLEMTEFQITPNLWCCLAS